MEVENTSFKHTHRLGRLRAMMSTLRTAQAHILTESKVQFPVGSIWACRLRRGQKNLSVMEVFGHCSDGTVRMRMEGKSRPYGGYVKPFVVDVPFENIFPLS